MPRLPFRFSPDDFYHLTGRSNNRDWFELPGDEVWRIMSSYLHFMHYSQGAKIGSFVLMGNHFHLLARFPEEPLSKCMQYFMRETSRSLARESGRINHVYGGRVFRSRITAYHHLQNVYKYVYRNPVEAGLCSRVEHYRYSTLNGLLGASHLLIPVEEDERLFSENAQSTLNWLNTSPEQGHLEAMRWGLREQIFALPKLPTSRRLHPLEELRY